MIIEQQTDPNAKLNEREVIDQYEVETDAALQLTVQDAELAESWIESHYLNVRWIEADMLYQSPPVLKVWEGTTIPRANISLFTVATHLNSLKAKIVGGLFFEQPPFVVRPRPSMSQDTVRAIEALEGEQLDEMKFRREAKRGLFSAMLFGTGIWKRGWRIYDKVEKKYVRKEQPQKVEVHGKPVWLRSPRSDEFDVEETKVEISEPFFEACDIREVLVDPGTRTSDIRDAKYVIHKRTVTYRELEKLAPELGYELPSEDVIREWFMPPTQAGDQAGHDMAIEYPGSSAYLHHAAPRFEKTTEDPLEEPLELLERWDDEKVISVLQRACVIRNTVNPLGKKPFYSVNWWDIADAFWGLGLGVVLSGEQKLQQGVTNSAADMASLALNPLVVRSRGANVTSQNIRQRLGGIIDVDGPVEDAFRYQDPPKIPPEIFAQLQMSQARAESLSGANELLTQGNLPARGRTSLGRTATGASALESAAMARIGEFIEDFVDQVFQPFLWDLHQMNKEFLPMDKLRSILNDTLGSDFKLDESDFLNGPVEKFEVLAGSHVAVKQQMAQAVALMVEVFQSPQTMQSLAEINGEFVDVGELLHMISDVSGFRNYYSIVKKMTPEMQQRMQQNNPGAQKAALMQQQQQNQQQLIDQKDVNRAVILALRQVIEQSMKNEAVTGQPTGEGFGSEEEG